MVSINIEKTEFHCQICNKKISLDISDESSYLSKTAHEEFFGMKLETFRIAHTIGSERHVNVVLIDHRGFFRGYVDSYKEALTEEQKPRKSSGKKGQLVILGEEIETIIDDDLLNCFLLVDNTNWLLEVVKLHNMNTKEITHLLAERIEESKKVYNKLPKPIKVDIADLEFQVFVKEDFMIALSFRRNENQNKFFAAAEMLSERLNYEIIPPRKRVLKLLITILKKVDHNGIDDDLLYQLLTDDRLYTKIKIKYKDRIPQIAFKICKRFAVKKDILTDILLGKKTVIDALEYDYDSLMNFKDLMEVVDYINRRKLLT
jgi:hypothetical protein